MTLPLWFVFGSFVRRALVALLGGFFPDFFPPLICLLHSGPHRKILSDSAAISDFVSKHLPDCSFSFETALVTSRSDTWGCLRTLRCFREGNQWGLTPSPPPSAPFGPGTRPWVLTWLMPFFPNFFRSSSVRGVDGPYPGALHVFRDHGRLSGRLSDPSLGVSLRPTINILSLLFRLKRGYYFPVRPSGV